MMPGKNNFKNTLTILVFMFLFFSVASLWAQNSTPPAEETTILVEESQNTSNSGVNVPEPPPAVVETSAKPVEVSSPPVSTSTPLREEKKGENDGISLVESGWGSMKLGAVMQAQFFASDMADDLDSKAVAFKIKRMRIILQGGFLKDKIGYLIQGDMVNTDGFLLDARASIKPTKEIEFRFGRFIPDFTYFMPINVGKLMAIDYPLVTESFAVWRQVGLELIFRQKYFEIYAGVFNGMRFQKKTFTDANGKVYDVSSNLLASGYMSATLDNLTDDNIGKDLLFRFVIKPPVSGLEMAGYIWYGMPQYKWFDAGSGGVRDDIANVVLFGGEVRYIYEKLSILGEYAMRRIYYPAGSVNPEGFLISTTPLISHGAFLHAGYRVIKPLEIFMRGDYFDSNLSNKNDGQNVWATLGINYYLDDLHARMTLEYIPKIIQKEVDFKDKKYTDHGIYFQLCLML